MNNDDSLDTSELADIMGLPRDAVDRWRRPAPRLTWTRDPVTRRWAQVEVRPAPPIAWSKVHGRVRYRFADVEAFLDRATSSRAAERLGRLQLLKKTRSETGSVSLEEFFK